MAEAIDVVGLHGGQAFGRDATAALARADVLVGSARHLDLLARRVGTEVVDLGDGLPAALDVVADRFARDRHVCVVASGDPGFFGIVRLLGERFGPGALCVHPAPSSVSLAFARVGLSWDDATIASAHGRDLDDAVAAVASAAKAAVLTSPDNPPEAVGKALLAVLARPDGRDAATRSVIVVSRLGEADEAVERTDLPGLASGSFDPLSVVILIAGDRPVAPIASLAWGRPADAFEHRAGMITKPEVRAIVLSKLSLPARGVLWDVGAGSGSVGIEAAGLAPGIRVVAVERAADDVARIHRNAASHLVDLEVVHGEAPAAFAGLPDPDRVFVGGGGLDAIDAALARLRPGGVLVATHVLLDRAAAAWERLGNLVEVSVSRGAPIGAGVRLQAENPIFVTWGPRPT